MKNKMITDIFKTCLVCGQQFGDQNFLFHVHSYFHHVAVEQLKGKEQLHKCQACKVSVMGLEMYKEHISTDEHTFRLFHFQKRNRKSYSRTDTTLGLTKDEILALQNIRPKFTEKLLLRCFVCCHRFPVQDLDLHFHSFIHHQVVEKLTCRPELHKCWACDVTKMGLEEFRTHIKSQGHKYKLFKLQKQRTEGKNVDYSADIDAKLLDLCKARDQLKRRKFKGSHVIHTVPVMEHMFTEPDQNPQNKEQESRPEAGVTNDPQIKYIVTLKNVESVPEKQRYCPAGPQSQMQTMEPDLMVGKGVKKKNDKIKQGNVRKCNTEQEPIEPQLETFQSQASEDWEIIEIVDDDLSHSGPLKRKIEQDVELVEKSLEDSSTSEQNSCNGQKIKKQKIIERNVNPKKCSQGKVNQLLKLSSKEDELTSSLENVDEELVQAYFTLQEAHAEVQRLLRSKQKVKSEMAMMRERRIKILQDMKSTSERSSSPDQQMVPNA